MFRFFRAHLGVCPFLPSPIQGPIEVVKVDQEGWEKFGVCGANECCKGFEGATLLIHQEVY
jgi:hypothetical protein